MSKSWEERLAEIPERQDTESVMALPCLSCEYPSAKQECPRCGRFKW